MGQNHKSDEEINQNQRSHVEIGENQRSDEEINQNQSNDEEIGENQRSDEEIDQNQSNDEEISQHQTSDDEIAQNQRSDEEIGTNKYWRDAEPSRCIVSDLAHPHNLSRVAGYETKQDCFSCGKRSTSWEKWDFGISNFHYYCPICQVEFHSECRDCPSKRIHPYHLQHPLTFTYLNNETGMIVDTNYRECYDFKSQVLEFKKTLVPISSSNIMFDKCSWCGSDLGEWFYRCLICNFSLDLDHCAKKNPPLTIQNPKSHHHSLSFFPRPLSFPCDACGLINLLEPSYACYQCNYLVHQGCIDLPRVIKLTRHPHRLSHTPYPPTKVSSCRICYKNVDIKYGQYSCSHEDCSYVAHSKCATHDEVWDGEELEWEPEEYEETKAIAPYKEVGPGLIEHFCHDHHHLKLERYDGRRDSGKQCQACMCSITSHGFYNCVECDYFIHEVCANLPRQLDHALHNHSLFLDPYPRDNDDLLCDVCIRVSSCWKYVCKKDGCTRQGKQFMVDVNCVLVPECFTHQSHPEHLLFISTTYGDYDSVIHCQGCKKEIYGYLLRCTICEFAICYECSTIPYELYCKFYEHPLSLCYGENGVDAMHWCEVCETKLDPREWFYTNKEGCTTIHLKCLFGDLAYMKSGLAFDKKGDKVEAVSNSSSRPKCRQCQHRCPHSIYLKVYRWDGKIVASCSLSCLYDD